MEEYVKSGREQMVIDPDPDKIYTKRKKRIMNVMSCTPSIRHHPAWNTPSDAGWGKSLERMPSFTRIDSQLSLLKEKMPDLEKKFRALEWRNLVLLREYFKKWFPLLPNLKTMSALYEFNVLPDDINVRQQTIFILEKWTRHMYTVFN